LRIWIVDNSGSMLTNDGTRILETKNNDRNVRYVQCTRWRELQDTVEYHARLAALLKAPTVFRLLNDPGQISGPQQFSVGERPDFIQEDLESALHTIKTTVPEGATPLGDHLREIRENIMEMKDDLVPIGQKVVVVIATDGRPSDEYGVSSKAAEQDFVQCLRNLEGLPLWIVIRLCTDNDDVVEFYNNIDSQLELSLEVLDDFHGEAEEVYEHNNWLNYALPMHRVREMGFSNKLYDLLDERALTKDELKEFFCLMFNASQFDAIPDPHDDWKGFALRIKRLVDKETVQYNPVTSKMQPWVDLKCLTRKYSPEKCTIM